MTLTRVHYTILAGLALLFGVVTVLKYGPSSTDESVGRPVEKAAQRQVVRRFWRVYRRATKHRTAGAYERAARAYEEALAIDSTHEDALYYLGHAYMKQRKLRQAEAAWRRLVSVNPSSARGHTQLGELRFCFPEAELFDLEAAQAAYEQALALHNEETHPLVRLATIALIQHRMEVARRYTEAVVGSNERAVAGPLLRGYFAWKRDDLGRASVRLAQASALARQEARKGRSMERTCPLADVLLTPETPPHGPHRTEWIEQHFTRFERKMYDVRG